MPSSLKLISICINTSDLYNNKVILTNDDNYTHAIIINTCMPKLNIPKENVIGISHEPYIWLFINKNKQVFIEYAL